MLINRILKWLVGSLLAVVLLLVAATFLLNTKSVQQWLLKETTRALSDKLQTTVSADSVSVNLFLMQMSLYGLSVDDRQGREMLAVSRFDADVSLKSVLQWRVVVNKVRTEGLRASLVKERADSAANYQFVVDALARKEKPDEPGGEARPKSKVKIDFRRLIMSDTRLSYSQPGGKAKAQAEKLDLYLSGEEAEVEAENVRMSADGMTFGKETVRHADLTLSFRCEASWGDAPHADISVKCLDLRWPEKNIDLKGLILDAEGDDHTAQLKGLSLTMGEYAVSLSKADATIPASQSWKEMKQLTVNAAGLSVKQAKTANLVQVANASAVLTLGKKPDLHQAGLSGLKLRYATPKQSVTAAATYVRAGRLRGKYTLDVSGLQFTNDNHRPRKNTGKPKRGWFDAGHLNISAQMKWMVDPPKDGVVSAQLVDASLRDPVAGIDMKNVQMKMALSQPKMQITGLSFRQQTGTTVSVASADVTLPGKKEGRPLSFHTGEISAHVVLADIAHLFAPVLKDFKLPLRLTTTMSGDQNALHFRGVSVSTPDKDLTITASGDITNLREKHKLVVRFQVSQMLAKVGVPERIVNQFPVKKLMMGQLHKLGDIRYSGDFEVVYKKENFQGRLTTNAGPIDFTLSVDNAGKWVSGTVRTDALNVGRVLEMENIGDVMANAEFRVDISKERTAAMRRQKGGKLPIGTVSAHVDDCSYKRFHVHNLDMDLESDGAVASGEVIDHGKLLDLSCRFSFTDTDEMNKMKVTKAGLKFHKRDEKEKVERRKAKEERKQAREEQKEARKQAKQEQKEARKQAKEEHRKEKQERKQAASVSSSGQSVSGEETGSPVTPADSSASPKKKKRKILGIF